VTILAIDPGTKCGWALFRNGKRSASGVWDLKPRTLDGAGMRFVKLRTYLDRLAIAHSRLHVAFEEVRRHLGTDAAHIYGGIVAVITAWCEEHGYDYEGIPVGTIKKFATGKGNANKAMMVAAARERWPVPVIVTEDEADALWIGACASQSLDGLAGRAGLVE